LIEVANIALMDEIKRLDQANKYAKKKLEYEGIAGGPEFYKRRQLYNGGTEQNAYAQPPFTTSKESNQG
jgi:hypothetical protein